MSNPLLLIVNPFTVDCKPLLLVVVTCIIVILLYTTLLVSAPYTEPPNFFIKPTDHTSKGCSPKEQAFLSSVKYLRFDVSRCTLSSLLTNFFMLCKSCYGKGSYSVVYDIIGSGDFIGEKGFVERCVREERPCKVCNGKGKVPSHTLSRLLSRIKF